MDDKLMHYPKFDIKINPSVVIDYWLKSLDIGQGKKTFYKICEFYKPTNRRRRESLNDVIKMKDEERRRGKENP